GGPNFILNNPKTGQPEGPRTFQSDSLRSYELGYKAETPHQRFGIDADVYYIVWNNIQTTTILPNSEPAIVNAPGGAISEGAELTANARPLPPLIVIASLAATHAYFRQAVPALPAKAGDTLPNAPRFSGAISADYTFHPLGRSASTGFTVRYVDARTSGFGSSLWALPPYTTVDLRAGLNIGSTSLQLYAHNVFNARGQQSVNTGFGYPQVTILQPRTVGISARVYF
ncbi:MAG TPA: TonB-dependent receptor, partial [Nitrospira sp.]|nr:TonB-dependent receptor [Nitrospira sp.]